VLQEGHLENALELLVVAAILFRQGAGTTEILPKRLE
jgi:hypothetical protein